MKNQANQHLTQSVDSTPLPESLVPLQRHFYHEHAEQPFYIPLQGMWHNQPEAKTVDLNDAIDDFLSNQSKVLLCNSSAH